MSDIGHNGGPPIDVDPNEIKMSWIKLDIADFKRGVRDMDMEMRGYYISILVEMYDNRGRLPNDLTLLGKRLGTTARAAKRVVEFLIDEKKVYVSGDWIRNQRCDEEREKLIEEYVRRHNAAVKREASKRANAPATPEVTAKFGGSFSEVSTELGQNSEKLRESFPQTIGNNQANSIGQHPDLCLSSDRNCAHNLEKKKKEEVREEDIRAAGAAQPADAIETAFDEFWAAFPSERKRGKGKCRDLFRSIAIGRNPKRKARAEDIVAAVRAGSGIDPKFPPMPTTWLNEGRWEDSRSSAAFEPAPHVMPDGKVKVWGWWRGHEETLRNLPLERWEKAFAEAKPNGIWPWWILTAPPGHPECYAPMVLQAPLIPIYNGEITHA